MREGGRDNSDVMMYLQRGPSSLTSVVGGKVVMSFSFHLIGYYRAKYPVPDSPNRFQNSKGSCLGAWFRLIDSR